MLIQLLATDDAWPIVSRLGNDIYRKDDVQFRALVAVIVPLLIVPYLLLVGYVIGFSLYSIWDDGVVWCCCFVLLFGTVVSYVVSYSCFVLWSFRCPYLLYLFGPFENVSGGGNAVIGYLPTTTHCTGIGGSGHWTKKNNRNEIQFRLYIFIYLFIFNELIWRVLEKTNRTYLI